MSDINAKSVVDSLMENLTLDSGSKVVVDEKSLLAELSEQRDSNPRHDYRWEGFRWQIDRNARLPLLKASCGLLWSCFMGLAFLFYYLCEKVLWIFTRKDFNLRSSIRFNAVICSGVVVIFTTLLVYMMVFLIKDVILFPMQSGSNLNGTLCMTQPCCIDHYVRLLGSDECWVDTGIRIGEGDKVSIVYSGAFYGDIEDSMDAAKLNRKLKYSPSSHAILDMPEASGSSGRFCMYGSSQEKDAVFGTLLYQIKSETERPVYRNKDVAGKAIFQISGGNSAGFTAERSGVLCFAVNDIYVHDDDVFIEELKAAGLLTGEATDIRPAVLTRQDSIYLQKRDLMFQDNIGEYLLHVTVARSSFEDHRPMFHHMIKTYRWIYIDGNWKWMLAALLSILAVDLTVGICMRKSRKKVAEKQN